MLNGLHLIGFVCFIFFFGNNLLVPGTDEIQEPTDVHVIIISQTSLNVLNQNKDTFVCANNTAALLSAHTLLHSSKSVMQTNTKNMKEKKYLIEVRKLLCVFTV